MTDWQTRANKVLFNVAKRIPVTIARGRGVYVWDDKDKEYFDFVGGWAVCLLGHCHPVIIEAINQQAKTLIQTSPIFHTIPYTKLAELLVKSSCLDRVFMANSGLEANEGAVKLARRFGKLRKNGAYEVITAFNSFHERSLAMTAATGQPKYQEAYQPLPAGFVNVPYNDIEAIKKATNNNTCAIMLEPLQGEGGVNLPQPGYLPAVRQWCDEKGILLILDEIQTGMGRLGTLWGYQLYGIEPDIMTLAKGLGGGVPIGAFLSREEFAVFQPGDHGTTFGGNPLTCATSLAVLEYTINHDIPGAAKQAGQYLLDGLMKLQKNHPCIKQVRGQGLLAAFEFDREMAADVLHACLQTGVLVNAVKPNAIRLMPPLVITDAEIDEGLNRIEKALAMLEN